MDTQQFIRIERDENGKKRHSVVSRREPGFSVEVIPQSHGDGPWKQPVIRRVCMPNSWTGDYHRYSGLVTATELFLEQCDRMVAGRRFV